MKVSNKTLGQNLVKNPNEVTWIKIVKFHDFFQKLQKKNYILLDGLVYVILCHTYIAVV